MLRRLGVRGKILATLAVPVLVLVLGAGFLVSSATKDWQYARMQSSFLSAVIAQDELVSALQTERWHSVAVASGRTSSAEALVTARTKVNNANAVLDRALSKIRTKGVAPAVLQTLANATNQRSNDSLALARSLVDERAAAGNAVRGSQVRSVMSHFDSMIDAQLNLNDIVGSTVENRDLGTYVIAYANVNRLLDQMLVEAQSGQILIEDNFANIDTELDRRTVAIQMASGESIRQNAIRTVDDLARPGLEVPGLTNAYTSARDGLLQAAPAAVPISHRTQWADNAQDEMEKIVSVRDDVRTMMINVGKSAESGSARTLAITLAIAALALVASVAVALSVARTISEPIRRLNEAAGRVRDDLPRIVDEVAEPGKAPSSTVETIELDSQDEIGELATTFNQVNEVTLRVAREQAALRGSIAEMFINVARRDQVLLNRQLVFLDELERSEEDPGTLANLFRLDHLATRMRRNAESLLVLAGIESGRRVRSAMPLSDVVRTAASEIELYERVELDLEVDAMMLGHNALPAAHLIAELLENATVFSDPGTPVVVSAREDARWIVVEVRDHGLGMTPEELDAANEKASTYAASEIAGSQRLGLYVVGRLAYKLGASVRFTSAEDGTGTVARVMIPRALFLANDEVPLDAPVDVLAPATQAATEEWVAPTPADAHAGYEEEPPVVRAVDLDALTDGSTSAGMPRRRTRAAGAVPEQAPSASLGPDAQDIVLPELAAPELPSDFGAGASDLWTPPSAVLPAAVLPTRGGANPLPTRRPAAPSAIEPEVDALASGAPAADVPERAAVFSTFRTRRSLEFLGQDSPKLAEPEPHADEPAAPQEPVFEIPGLEPDVDVPTLAAEPAPTDGALGLNLGLDLDHHEDAAWEPTFALESLGEPAAQPVPAQPVEPVAEPAAFGARTHDLPADEPWTPVTSFETLPAPTDAPALPVTRSPLRADARGAHEVTPDAAPLAPAVDETPTFADDARLRSLGAHVGSIASAADLDDVPEAPTRRGRYARYTDDVPAQAVRAAAPEQDIDLGHHLAQPIEDAPAALPVRGIASGLPTRSAVTPAAAPHDDWVPELAFDDEPAADLAPFTPDDVPVDVAPVAVEHVAAYVEPEPAPVVSDASPEIAPFALTESGQALPSFESVLAAAPAPVTPAAAEPKREKRGLFGIRRKSKAAPAAQVAPAPAATAPSPAWSAPAAPSASAAEVATPQSTFTPEPADLGGFTYSPRAFEGSVVPSARSAELAPAEVASDPHATPSAFSGGRRHGQDHEAFAPAPQTTATEPPAAAPATQWGAGGGLDPELSARLALQAGIQEQALAELSQLSAYRPNQLAGSGGSLTKRVRGEVPQAESVDPTAQKISRDAAELRSRLSSFVSATNRARQESDPEPGTDILDDASTPDPAPQSR